MTKSEKLLYRGASKSLRRELTKLRQNKATRKPFMMLHLVERPGVVTLCNGQRVPYEGP